MERVTYKRWIICVVLLTVQQISSADDLPLLMPDVKPQQNDLYLCIDKKIDNDLLYITGFQPNASMSVAHHMLIYGCSEPGKTGGSPWNCGEMHQGSSSEFSSGPVCKDSGRIIYAWAMDAPELKLPDDVAFKIGAATAMKYLVIQVHYKDASSFLPPSDKTDNSGVILKTTDQARAKTAGVYLIAANGRISPNSVTYMEAACTFQDPLTIYPFAYRVHTHKLGKVVSGYRLRDGKWTEIGRRNPQLPQMFYPVDDSSSVAIQQGDILAARCTMENTGNTEVAIGPTSDDEMCNFYIMYYTSGEKDVQDPICTSPGPPNWSWSNFFNPKTIPYQASVDPITNNWFKEYQRQFDDIAATLRESQRQMEDRFKNFFGKSRSNFNYDYPNYNIPPMNFNPPESLYNYYNPLDSAYDYHDPDTKKAQNLVGGNPSNVLGGATVSKATVLSSVPISQSKAKYKYVNGKFVKVEDTAAQDIQAPQPAPAQPPASPSNFLSPGGLMPQFDLSKFNLGSFNIPPINMPPMNPVPPPAGAQDGPGNWESFQTFNDNNGGVGSRYMKNQNSFKEYKIPGGSVKSSHSSSSSSSSYSKSSSTTF